MQTPDSEKMKYTSYPHTEEEEETKSSTESTDTSAQTHTYQCSYDSQ